MRRSGSKVDKQNVPIGKFCLLFSMALRSILSATTRMFLDTLFPIMCVKCGMEGEWLCRSCAVAIPLKTRETCFVCKEPSRAWRTCYSCRSLCTLSGVIGFFEYSEDIIKTILKIAKYGFVKDILPPLLRVIAPYVTPVVEVLDLDPRAVLLVPVPLHPRRLRERGFNQSEIIAKAFALASGATFSSTLTRRGMRPPQASLDAFDRARNIRKTFTCSDPASVRGRLVFIIDDVATTGSTLDECGRVLKNAGAAEVWGIVLARG